MTALRKHLSKILIVVVAVLIVVPVWAAPSNYSIPPLQGGDTLAVACDGLRLDATVVDATHQTLNCVPNTTTTTSTSSTTSTTSTSTTSTTTTLPTTSTSTSTSTTTTTTTPPTGGLRCGLVDPAFCDTFDVPRGGGTATGDLDPVIWGVSRVGIINPSSGYLNSIPIPHNFCAGGAATPPPGDVRICNGQMVEAINDGGHVLSLDTYPKQPFNFDGRTGKVTFDVSADSGGTHSAWPEFFITDEPVPGLRSQNGGSFVPGITARNQVGFSLAGCGSGGNSLTGVNAIFTTINGVEQGAQVPMTTENCITRGSRTAMNHIEVRVSTSRIEVWGTDAGSTVLKRLVFADNLNLAFSQGLVWLSDTHYNASKGCDSGCAPGTGDQTDHNFIWDNLGFDGPKTYRDWGFDVPSPNTVGTDSFDGYPTINTGWWVHGSTPLTLSVPNVAKGVATSAKVVVNSNGWSDGTLSVSVNGNAPIGHAVRAFTIETFSFPVPLAQIVNGTNTLRFTSTDANMLVTNVTLIMVAAGPVP